jgi:hypothetical protein
MIHADLQSKGLLQQAPGQGGSCANWALRSVSLG